MSRSYHHSTSQVFGRQRLGEHSVGNYDKLVLSSFPPVGIFYCMSLCPWTRGQLLWPHIHTSEGAERKIVLGRYFSLFFFLKMNSRKKVWLGWG